jgi:hypothetical protein
MGLTITDICKTFNAAAESERPFWGLALRDCLFILNSVQRRAKTALQSKALFFWLGNFRRQSVFVRSHQPREA